MRRLAADASLHHFGAIKIRNGLTVYRGELIAQLLLDEASEPARRGGATGDRDHDRPPVRDTEGGPERL